MTRSRLLTSAAVAVALGVPAAGAANLWMPAQADSPTEQEVVAQGEGADERVLLVSLPGLTWADVQEYDLPAIEAFLEEAALANHAPRGARVRSSPGGAYLTIGSGSRAIGQAAVDGEQLALEDQAAGSAAGEIFERRAGVYPDGEYVALAWPTLLRRNRAEPYDAELGLLHSALTEAGFGTGVIGNADGTDTMATSYDRQVGLATATVEGVVPAGDLSADDLLEEAPLRPFGVRLDIDRVIDRFTEIWAAPDGRPGGLVVVEASDLARTMRYRNWVGQARYNEFREQALVEADLMVGRLLDQVEPGRDSVILLAPYNLPGNRDLTVAALQTRDARAGITSGYLGTASTQRSGFVTLVDVAPSILRLLGVDRPTGMEGRPFEVTRSSDSLDRRVERLVAANAASRFRENLLVPTTLVIVVALGLVVAMAIACVAREEVSGTLGGLVRVAALFTLAIMPLSYLARAFPLEDRGLGFYWAFVLIGAAVAAGTATAAAAVFRRPRLALVLTLVVAAGVPAFDAVTGSRLSLSAAFGYSPTGNSRLYGISNYALGMFGAAVCVLAGLWASRDRGAGRRNRVAAVGLTVAALMVIGVPIWGANVGGILSFSPVVVLFGVLVLGTHLRIRLLLVGFVVATAAAVTMFAGLDLARAPEERAHLGRLVERVGDEGPGPLFSIMSRKAVAAVEVSFTSFWTASVVVALALLVALRLLPDRPLDRVKGKVPYLQAGLTAAFAAAVFGSIANDSGSIVGGTAMLVVAVTIICLIMEPQAPPDRPVEVPAEVSTGALLTREDA